MIKYFCVLIFFSLLVHGLYAQKLTTSSNKAKKFYEEASQHLTYGQYYEAELKLDKALKADPDFCEAYLLLGDLHSDLNEKESAIKYYLKSIKINPDFYPPVYFFLGQLQIGLGDYKNAEISFKQYISYEDIETYTRSVSERNILNCQFAQQALLDPVEFAPLNLGPEINSTYSEYFPTMTVDGRIIIYTRLLGESGHHQQEDFYVSGKNRNEEWMSSQNMGKSINTSMNEGAATISADGKTLIFTACEQNGIYGYGREGYGSCDLFFARRQGNNWSKAINLGTPINTNNWESQPSLSSDGESLYFVRGVNRGNRRESDIMVSHLDKEGYWSKPEKLGDQINTEESEESVYIHPDNRTLYFSSRGHIGMGGSDIYMSKKNENNEWGAPVNIGYPINTFNDENSLLVGPDGQIGYFASNREGGFGELDIYAFEMTENIQADPVSYFKGVVYDSLSRVLLAANIELIDIETANVINTTKSDSYTGEFFLTLNPHHNYLINVSKEGYLFYSDGLQIKEKSDLLKPYIKNIPLLALSVGNSIVLKNIFFETDKSELKTESYTELSKLMDFLRNNPSLHIEIGGHTDHVGSYEYNKNLSESRAKAVNDYLITHGIAESRLTYKGYSFDFPISTNETEEGRALNRRTEFKIIAE